jgi:hypothetical protein
MNKLKIIAGIILFGSLWGFSECIIGSYFHEVGLPAGAIMTGIFAVGFMLITRLFYRQKGMQLGMALVAGALRLFNPFGGCYICAAIAIMAEGALFELVWYKMTLNLEELKKPIMSASMGIITTYIVFVGGYIITQILTPLFSSAGFYLENLINFLPQILSRGLLAAILGGITVPTAMLLKNIDITRVRDKIYYPTAAAISALCWTAVIINTLLII